MQVRWTVGYEPYMVGDRSKVPLYNETFVGRGRNKMAHSLAVHVQGYVISQTKWPSTRVFGESRGRAVYVQVDTAQTIAFV